MPRRSLSLRLINGNILNAVKFKLLLPETRNNLHEILGSLLIKNVGFIVPETFQVKTNINGSEAIMLFQEDAAKEMLERNNDEKDQFLRVMKTSFCPTKFLILFL